MKKEVEAILEILPDMHGVPPANCGAIGLEFFCSTNSSENSRCGLVLSCCGLSASTGSLASIRVPRLPALVDGRVVIFGADSICRYLLAKTKAKSGRQDESDVLLDLVEVEFKQPSRLISAHAVKEMESRCFVDGSSVKSLPILTSCALYPFLQTAAPSGVYPHLQAVVAAVEASPFIQAHIVQQENASKFAGSAWETFGIVSSLKSMCTEAIKAAFPQAEGLSLHLASITRCSNPLHGDFQCNNAMALSKAFKASAVPSSTGHLFPKDIAEAFITQIPPAPLISKISVAPNGFVNIYISTEALVYSLAEIIQKGPKPPSMAAQKVLVDFSSPNIAKEMHVGHLRSTIIGDAICRVLEFCGMKVLRVNHVGDWGTQFGMLITFLMQEYPDILTTRPNISDLTAIYKASKKRFDEDESFKETSRMNVVRLQAGDAHCRAIWTLLCDISRAEFQNVYNILQVELEEVGESFYNGMIPGIIKELETLTLAVNEDGMLIVKLAHFTIPLIVRKSDGGYGYDSTDMAAISYRVRELKCDWVIYITDAGQAPHFHMIFDAARAAGWISSQRLDHIGFGVVCGEDGKRFKTRASETVRLIDLLNAAKFRMQESLEARRGEGKTSLQQEDVERAASIIGYGAVKYFDLKQHPSTNYVFSYDRMLDTKGDTAVYLLFAYARLASILRKAVDEKGWQLQDFRDRLESCIFLSDAVERALAFELLQFGDVLKSVLHDLLLNRLCDYLKELCVKFTDFVTKCQILNSDKMDSRLLLCEATRRVMEKCFELLGIGILDKL